MIEVLILAAIALFVLSRLYTALGRDDGPPEGRNRSSQPTPMRPAPANARTERSGEALDPKDDPAFTGPAAGGLEEIYHRDNSFNPKEFIQGARAAYEMIVEAFSRSDRDTLKPLLDTDVYAAWDEAMTARDGDNSAPFGLLRIRKAEIDSAGMDGDTARVSVFYEADLGDGERTRTAREIWTFKRDVRSDDPNWILDDVEAVDG